jgi:hypothetical protein
MDEVRRVLSYAVQKLLYPLIRILLRNGVPFGTFMELAKWVYVEVASKEFGIPGKKQTDSRVSVLTGLSRKEVKHVKEKPMHTDEGTVERYNRAARVINGWVQDRTFLDGWGEPAILPMEGEGATFTLLVNEYSGDVPARAILDELLRVNAVERLQDGRIRLLQRAYVPRTSEVDKLGILGTDVAFLIATIDHNLVCDQEEAYFQRKVAYDNLPVEALPELKRLTETHGQALLEKLNEWLAQQDRDSNPKVNGTGRKHAGVGIYFFEQDISESEQ